jgi:hypothetical protein
MTEAWVWSHYRGVLPDDVSQASVWGHYVGELPQSADERSTGSAASTPLSVLAQRGARLTVGFAGALLVVAGLTWLFSP